MCLSNLPQIVEGLTLGGMDKSTPAAVLGSENIRATLGDIVEKSQGVLAPAVIVVGGTAGMNLWN